MNKSGAWAWATTLGVVSVLTFLAGLAMGYALFAPRTGPLVDFNQAANPVEKVDLTKTASTEPKVKTPASMVNPNEEATTPAVIVPAADTPAAEKPDDFNPAAHLFIAVNGQWLADGTREFLKELQPGGVVLRARNVVSEEQTLSLVNDIKLSVGQGTEFYDRPLIALSQEGGSQNILRIPGAESAMDLGIYDDGSESRRLGRLYGETAKSFGVNIVLGPMLDVYNETTAFPDMEARSFGHNQNQVALQGLAMAEGLRAGGVIPVAKHFPGYAFSGYGADGMSVVINSDFNDLARAIYPFREAINKNIEGLIVGHIAVPILDKDFPERPAALSPVLVSELLRDRWGFQGVIIADEMAFNEMTRSYPVERAVVESLIAGCDAVIFLDPNPRKIQAVVDEINRAVETGELSRDALMLSQQRLEDWRLTLGADPFSNEDPPDTKLAMVAENATEESPVEPAPTVTAPEPVPAEPAPTEATTPEEMAKTPAEPTPPAPAETAPAEAKPEEAKPEPAPEPKPEEAKPEPAPEPKPEEPQPESAPKPEEAKPEPKPEPAPAPKPEEPAKPEEKPEATEVAVKEEPTPAPTPEKMKEEPKVSESVEALAVAVDESTLTELKHTVKEGETLLQIAWDYDVKSEDIIRWNKLESMTIAPNTDLKIFTDAPPAPEAPAAAEKMETPAPKPEAVEVAKADPKPEMTEAPKEPAPEPKPEEPAPEPVPEPKPEEPKPEPEPAPKPEEPKPEPVPEPKPEESKPVEVPVGAITGYKLVHLVVWDDTLSTLAKMYTVRTADIQAWNTLEADEQPKANSSLLIYFPTKSALSKFQVQPEIKEVSIPADMKFTTYEVQPGDTMTKIAREHNTKVEIITQVNKLKDSGSIYVGQKLKVPAI